MFMPRPFLACVFEGLISFSITKMPAAQRAILPSLPALIHQATQIFSPNPLCSYSYPVGVW